MTNTTYKAFDVERYHAAAAATAAAVLVLYGFIDIDEFALIVVDADDANVADDNVDTVEEDNEGDAVDDVVVKDDIVFLSELLLLLIEFNKFGILLIN
ncbi:hypothetical protein Smp_035640 [Schistosoma mansoni]|uniref:hypothetical protein n=1 Tax=Schistosoma mansoni TaxID=6183 RepID=UPI0001A9422C|nr:hypothetical protein Smp_035640 [Schistosoma mansoni]|eukprot:XP_018647842.1 hypothetical protein Smp_035640 [Schistosoma mansoni]